MNVIAWPEVEVDYYNAAVQHVTYGNSHLRHLKKKKKKKKILQTTLYTKPQHTQLFPL